MKNDYLKEVLLELQNIYEELKSNKDKRMIKKLIIKVKEWIENAENTKIPELIECAKTYRNWLTEIVNSFYVPYNNGVIEGTNNKIKVLKRNSYGCKNFNNFKTRILLCTK